MTDSNRSEPALRLLRLRDVKHRTGLSSTGVYELEAAGRFPRRRRLSQRTSAWLEHEIDAWIAQRPLATDNEKVEPQRVSKVRTAAAV